VYREQLEARLGRSREVMRVVINKAKKSPKRIVYPEGDHEKILRASQIIIDEGIAHPILLGNKKVIKQKIEDLKLDLPRIQIFDPYACDRFEDYAREFYELRQRHGVTVHWARKMMRNRNYFGSMMVRMGDADGLISGVTQNYPETIRPALQVIKVRDDVRRVSGVYMMIVKNDVYFFSDATVNIDPTADDLAEIAICCAEQVRRFEIEPRVAMLSFSNFGSTKHPLSEKVKRAVEIVKERVPDLAIDGEMQADTAVVPEIIRELYPFCQIPSGANVLIFPDLQSGNIAYKLLARLGGAEAIGPILMGMSKPVHVLQFGGGEVKDVVNMTAVAVVDAQNLT